MKRFKLNFFKRKMLSKDWNWTFQGRCFQNEVQSKLTMTMVRGKWVGEIKVASGLPLIWYVTNPVTVGPWDPTVWGPICPKPQNMFTDNCLQGVQRQAKSGFRTMITAGCLGDRQTKKVHRKGVARPTEGQAEGLLGFGQTASERMRAACQDGLQDWQ